MNDYSSEKLSFVSNLNGTTLNEIFALLTLFPLINYLSVLIKAVALFYLNTSYIQRLNSKNNGSLGYFW